jgi:hypothetical protein
VDVSVLADRLYLAGSLEVGKLGRFIIILTATSSPFCPNIKSYRCYKLGSAVN